ncbi:MAG: hypothetical protein K2X47_12725 [Bdellovibrionales bacterium]|nr:hypothetical protein [Bdellovibrionales bacterium]
MVRIVPSELPKITDPNPGVTKRVHPKPPEHAQGDLLQKDPTKASRIAEVIQMFRKKSQRESSPRNRNRAIKRYLESQDQFEVGDPRGFRIDRKV